MKRRLAHTFTSDSVHSSTLNKQPGPNYQGLTSCNSTSSLQSGRTSIETGIGSQGSRESLSEGEDTEKMNTVKTEISRQTCEKINNKTFGMIYAFKAIPEDADAHYQSHHVRAAATEGKEAATEGKEAQQQRSKVVSPIPRRQAFMDLSSLADNLPGQKPAGKKYCR
jgi:hypothetical protein